MLTRYVTEILKSLAPLKDMSCVFCQYFLSKALFRAQGENGQWWTRQAGGKVWNHFG